MLKRPVSILLLHRFQRPTGIHTPYFSRVHFCVIAQESKTSTTHPSG